MVRYLLACSAAIYCVLLVFGDESRRPEIARQTQDDVTGLSLAAFALPDEGLSVKTLESDISDVQAVQIALRAGQDYRANRERKPLRGLVAAVEAETEPDTLTEDAAKTLWYVTGTAVNLRSGPGTGNAVIGQVRLGDAAEVLSDENGWYQIRTAEGAVSGWIYGTFLAETEPG